MSAIKVMAIAYNFLLALIVISGSGNLEWENKKDRTLIKTSISMVLLYIANIYLIWF